MSLAKVRWPAGILVAVSVLACQRELVAPGECPQTCPGGSPVVIDTVLVPLADMDSSFTGYVDAGAGNALLVSDLPQFNSRAIVKFLPRGDSVLLNDTLRAYTVDSVGFRIGLRARDTTVTGLELLLYRVPSDVDSTVTFADLQPFLQDSTLITSIAVNDTTFSQTFLQVVSDSATLDLLTLTPADSSVMAIAVAMRATQQSGVSIGSISAAGAGPLWQSYVTLEGVTDTTLNEQTINRIAQFNTFVVETPIAVDSTLLTVGGAPSTRSLLRFSLPPRLASRDSSQIVRATLQLVPTAPIPGIPNDSSTLRVRGVLSDIGAKSPRCNFGVGAVCGSWFISRFIQAPLVVGSSDTVSIEVSDLVRGWQGETGSAQALFLDIDPEASTFTRPEFGSTRTPGFVPVIRVSYALPFPFDDR